MMYHAACRNVAGPERRNIVLPGEEKFANDFLGTVERERIFVAKLISTLLPMVGHVSNVNCVNKHSTQLL